MASSTSASAFGIATSHRGHGFAIGNPHFQLGHWPAHRAGDVAMGGPSGRHGSGANPLDRERDRERGRSMEKRRARSLPGDARAQATEFRMAPVGPQEEADWSDALEKVTARLTALETTARDHAAAINNNRENIEKNRQRCEYLHGQGKEAMKKLDDHVKATQSNFTVAEGKLNVVDEKMAQLHKMIEELRGQINQAEESGANVRQAEAEPVHCPIFGGQIPTPTVNVEGGGLEAPVPQSPCPTGKEHVSSPLDGGARLPGDVPRFGIDTAMRENVAWSQAARATAQGPAQSQQDPWAQYHAHAAPRQMPAPMAAAAPSSWGPASMEPVEKVFSICRKRDDSIWVFKGTPADYKPWKDRIVDHCAITNDRWRVVLDYIGKLEAKISFADMEGKTMDDYPLKDLAKIFFNWISAWLPKRLYNKRVQLSGGEFGNGLELWRNLRVRFEGSGTICEVAGADALHSFPKCKQMKDLEEHLDDWEEMVDLYGGGLAVSAPSHLRVMLVKTLPSEVENELLEHPELNTMEKIIDYLRAKLIYKNQKHLASYIRPGQSRVNVMQSQEESDDDDEDIGRGTEKKASANALTQIAQMLAQQTEMIAAFHKKGPKRQPSPKPGAKKFVWTGGCHECGGDHMKKDCEKWKKVLAANGGKMPAGHVNAYTRARDAFNKANGIESPKPKAQPKKKSDRRTHANAMVSDDGGSECSSEDSEETYQVPLKALRTTHCCPMRVGTPIKNSFEILGDGIEYGEDEPEYITALNNWAHKVNMKTKKARVPNKKGSRKLDVILESEEDLDAALAENEVLRERMPGASSESWPLYSARTKKRPPSHVLADDEVWAMVDSGAGVDGMNVLETFPGANIEKAKNPIKCFTANGEEMLADQVARLRVELDGEESEIPFSNLPITMPIISVRRHIHRGYRCRIHENGGYFRNVTTRQKSKFIEKDGVYFMKMKIMGNTGTGTEAGFARPGSSP